MNTYTAKFWAKCPANGQTIDYTLKIRTREMIRVERIREMLDSLKEGFHEDIADVLQDQFGGEQTITAHHHGVDIETSRPMEAERKGPAA